MSFYSDRVLPRLVHSSMSQATLAPYRQRVTAQARGRVLEIGVGSGLNLPLYESASCVVGLDPSSRLLAMARATAGGLDRSIELLEGVAEAIPLPDHAVDTVVSTWTMCSIPELPRALAEMRRVLAPDGLLVFVEHGRSPEPGVARWQHRLTPLWKRLAGGCHLNRPIEQLVAAAGFRFDRIEKGYMDGPRPMTFMYEGLARPQH